MKTVLFIVTALILIAAAIVTGDEPNKLDAEIGKLLATDRAWAEAAAGDDVDKICTFWSDDAVLYNVFGSGKNVVGKEAIRAMVVKRRSVPGNSISWAPASGYVNESGDVGATRGTGTVIRPQPDGTIDTLVGGYFNVWKKVDGEWKCAFETHGQN